MAGCAGMSGMPGRLGVAMDTTFAFGKAVHGILVVAGLPIQTLRRSDKSNSRRVDVGTDSKHRYLIGNEDRAFLMQVHFRGQKD